jgi:hypothetical protein
MKKIVETFPVGGAERPGSGVYKLSDEECAAIDAALQEMRQGTFASDEAVAAVFNRHR